MNREQQIAFEHPCYIGAETFHPRYNHARPGGILKLTLSAGHE